MPPTAQSKQQQQQHVADHNTRRNGSSSHKTNTAVAPTNTTAASNNNSMDRATTHQKKINNKRQKMIHNDKEQQDHDQSVDNFSLPTTAGTAAAAATTVTDQTQQHCPIEKISWSSSSSSSSKQISQGIILSDSSNNLLQDLIAPMSCQDFLQYAFRQHAVYIPAITNDRMSIICKRLYNLNVEQILRHTSSDSIFVWLQQQQQQQEQQAPMSVITNNNNTTTCTTSNSRIQSIEIDNVDTAIALYKAGHATYCRAPPDLEQDLVSTLLENTGLGCGQYDPSSSSTTCLGRGEVEVFISSSSSSSSSHENKTTTGSSSASLTTTGWHTDFQENFTLQLSGMKQWTFIRGTISHPLRACTPHYQSPESVESQLKAARMVSGQADFSFDWPIDNSNKNNNNSIGPIEQVIMRPGDVLYFPAGMWHKVQVLEPGISINISLMATNFATITCQALQHFLLQKQSWRECIVAPRSSTSSTITSQQQKTVAKTAAVADDDGSKTTKTTSSVVDHLNKLLHELPGIIQEFQRNGGAQAILPPVLHHGKQFVNVASSQDWNDNDSEENNETTSTCSNSDENNDELDMQVVDHDDSHINHQNNDEVEKEASDSDDDDDDDDDDANDLVDLRTEPPRTDNLMAFDPSRAALRKRLDKYRLIKNPLAILIPEKDITQFYNDAKKDDDDDDAQQPFVYVLNVNYAGNESHESSIRVRIQSHDHANLHQAFNDEVKAETMARRLLFSNKENDDNDDEPCHTIAWLLYLGYLVWVERS